MQLKLSWILPNFFLQTHKLVDLGLEVIFAGKFCLFLTDFTDFSSIGKLVCLLLNSKVEIPYLYVPPPRLQRMN